MSDSRRGLPNKKRQKKKKKRKWNKKKRKKKKKGEEEEEDEEEEGEDDNDQIERKKERSNECSVERKLCGPRVLQQEKTQLQKIFSDGQATSEALDLPCPLELRVLLAAEAPDWEKCVAVNWC